MVELFHSMFLLLFVEKCIRLCACMRACMHVKCSPEVSRGDLRYHVIVEVAHRLLISLSVASLAVLFDTALLNIEVLSSHSSRGTVSFQVLHPKCTFPTNVT
jgi:hypothetical protein